MNSSNLKNKIQSNSGATIVFALVALIVCVMISAVVVYTAFSNVGRVKNTQSEEQNYLSVSSAVKMFENSIKGDSVSYEKKYEKVTVEEYDNNWEKLPPSATNPEITESETEGDANYNDVAKANIVPEAVFKKWAKELNTTLTQTLTATMTGDGNLPNIATVEAVIEFDPENDRITATFDIKDALVSDTDKYITIMTMDLSESTSYPITTTSEKKGKKGGTNIITKTVTKTVVYTISWDNFVITKKN